MTKLNKRQIDYVCIPFKDVIEAIAETAMKISEYPLILSFENHCRSIKL